jgi:hypothetical protein
MAQELIREHDAKCPKTGFRYASTVRGTKATRESGNAGKVVMICKNCPATKLV